MLESYGWTEDPWVLPSRGRNEKPEERAGRAVRDPAIHLERPRRSLSKPSSPEVWPGQIAEDELGLEYSKLDLILWRLERWMPPQEIGHELGIPRRTVEKVRIRWLKSEHKRRPPLSIKLGFRTAGQDLRIPYSL